MLEVNHEHLLLLLNECHKKRGDNLTTFFGIIDCCYDEKILTKMLAYLFSVDHELPIKLITLYRQKFPSNPKVNLATLKLLEVNLEVTLEDTRSLDLCVLFIDDKQQQLILGIENKILTCENKDQILAYESYLANKYFEAERCFFFLKPEYSLFMPVCHYFLVLDYKTLNEFITPVNEFVLDFKNHIKKYLEVSIMNEFELALSKNYPLLKEALKKIEFSRNNFLKFMDDVLMAKFENLISVNSQIGYQYYLNDWKKDEFGTYFFMEFSFKDGDPNKLQIQKVLRYNPIHRNTIIHEFLHGKNIIGKWYDSWFVLDDIHKDFSSTEYPLSEKWQEEAGKFIVDNFKRYFIEMKEINYQYNEYIA